MKTVTVNLTIDQHALDNLLWAENTRHARRGIRPEMMTEDDMDMIEEMLLSIQEQAREQ